MEVKEYWFETFRRVIVIKLPMETFISIDVYNDKWNYSINSELCINNKKLIYHKLNPTIIGLDSQQDSIELVGVNIGDRYELVNVRIRIKSRSVSDNFIKSLYSKVIEIVEKRKAKID